MKLINFSVGNFRSFLEEQTFRPNYADSHVNAIYGPNASGKSNLLLALFYCIRFIRSSTNKYNENIQDVFPIKPLLKSKELIYKKGYIFINPDKLYIMNAILLKLI